jgi:hypothetical protein
MRRAVSSASSHTDMPNNDKPTAATAIATSSFRFLAFIFKLRSQRGAKMCSNMREAEVRNNNGWAPSRRKLGTLTLANVVSLVSLLNTIIHIDPINGWSQQQPIKQTLSLSRSAILQQSQHPLKIYSSNHAGRRANEVSVLVLKAGGGKKGPLSSLQDLYDYGGESNGRGDGADVGASGERDQGYRLLTNDILRTSMSGRQQRPRARARIRRRKGTKGQHNGSEQQEHPLRSHLIQSIKWDDDETGSSSSGNSNSNGVSETGSKGEGVLSLSPFGIQGISESETVAVRDSSSEDDDLQSELSFIEERESSFASASSSQPLAASASSSSSGVLSMDESMDNMDEDEYTPTSVTILGQHHMHSFRSGGASSSSSSSSSQSSQHPPGPPGTTPLATSARARASSLFDDRPLTLEHHEVDYDLESPPIPLHYGYNYHDDTNTTPFMSTSLDMDNLPNGNGNGENDGDEGEGSGDHSQHSNVDNQVQVDTTNQNQAQHQAQAVGSGFHHLNEWDYIYDVKDKNKIAPPLPKHGLGMAPGDTLIPSSPRAHAHVGAGTPPQPSQSSQSNTNVNNTNKRERGDTRGAVAGAGAAAGAQLNQMQRLERDTHFVLNVVPVGQLTMPNLLVIQQLMSTWATLPATFMMSQNMSQSHNNVNNSSMTTGQQDTDSDANSSVNFTSTPPAIKVEQLIKRIVDDYNAGNPRAKAVVSTKMYNTLLRSWCNSGLPIEIAYRRVRTILKQMQHTYEETQDPAIQPDTQSFNYVLNLLSRSIHYHQQKQQRSSQSSQHQRLLSLDDEDDDNENESQSQKPQPPLSLIDQAEQLLAWMETLYESGRNTHVQPDCTSYTAVINAYARSMEYAAQHENKEVVAERVERALQLFHTLQELDREHLEHTQERTQDGLLEEEYPYDDRFKPSKFTYSSIINCLAKSGLVLAAKRADDLLQHMIQASQHNDHPHRDDDLSPDTVVVSTVLLAYAQIGTPGAAERAEQLLDYLEEQERQGTSDQHHLRPDLMCYNHVIHGWTRCTSHRKYILQAESILQRLEARSVTELGGQTAASLALPAVEPDKRTYNMILLAWSRCPDEGSASKADKTLRRMLEKHDAGDRTIQPDTVSFSHAMQAWGRSQTRGAAERAEALLLEMHTRYEAGNTHLKPTVRSFTAVLNAWSKTPKLGLAECTRAEEILHRMHYLTEVEGMDLRPDVFCYTIVLNCWGRSGLGSKSAKRTEYLLDSMWRNHEANPANPKPNVRSYNAVIDAWYRSGMEDAPIKCEETLNRMIDLYEAGETELAPETFSFNTVINIWLRSSRRNVGHRIEYVFEQMERMHEAGNKACAPDVRTFTALLNFYSRCRHPSADQKAELLLEKLVQKVKNDSRDDSNSSSNSLMGTGIGSVRPSSAVFGFKSIIEAWSKSRRPGSAQRADATLTVLEQLYREDVISDTPPASCYRSVIYGYASGDDLQGASSSQKALQRMKAAHEAGHIDEGPGVHEYILVLNALAKSRVPYKAVEAAQIFEDFQIRCPSWSGFARAYITAVTIVINACAFSTAGPLTEQREAFNIAKKCLTGALDSKFGRPNSILFGTFLKACGRLDMVEYSERADQIRHAFHKAHELGAVNDFVISQLKRSAKERLYTELMDWRESENQVAQAQAQTKSNPQNLKDDSTNLVSSGLEDTNSKQESVSTQTQPPPIVAKAFNSTHHY